MRESQRRTRKEQERYEGTQPEVKLLRLQIAQWLIYACIQLEITVKGHFQHFNNIAQKRIVFCSTGIVGLYLAVAVSCDAHLVTISFSLLEAWPPLLIGWMAVDRKYSLWFLKYWSTKGKTTWGLNDIGSQCNYSVCLSNRKNWVLKEFKTIVFLRSVSLQPLSFHAHHLDK